MIRLRNRNRLQRTSNISSFCIYYIKVLPPSSFVNRKCDHVQEVLFSKTATQVRFKTVTYNSAKYLRDGFITEAMTTDLPVVVLPTSGTKNNYTPVPKGADQA